MKWLLALWYRRCRRLDVQLMWPACKQATQDLSRARAAFACHALNDRAWLVLGEEEVCRRIDCLQ